MNRFSVYSFQSLVKPEEDRGLARFSKPCRLAESAPVDLDLYRSTKQFPKDELFGLTGQVRRACVSIGANIAEDCGRTGPDFGRFLQIAVGSASELQYHLLLSRDLELISIKERLSVQLIDTKKMLVRLLASVRAANC